MKRLFNIRLIAIALLCLAATAVRAQDEFFSKYANMEGTTSITISETLFKLLGPAIQNDDVNLSKVRGKIKKMQILTTEIPSICDSMKSDFALMQKTSGYEELMTVKDNQTDVVFYILRDGETVSNMIMVSLEPTDCTIMRLAGAFTLQDIMDMAGQ